MKNENKKEKTVLGPFLTSSAQQPPVQADAPTSGPAGSASLLTRPRSLLSLTGAAHWAVSCARMTSVFLGSPPELRATEVELFGMGGPARAPRTRRRIRREIPGGRRN